MKKYNVFNVYRRELAPGTVILTGDRAQGDDSKHWAYSNAFTVKFPQTPSRLKSSDMNWNLAGVDSQWDFIHAYSL